MIKRGQLVKNKTTNKQGKVQKVLSEIKQVLVEVIVKKDKETGERTTKLETWNLKDVKVVRNKKKKPAKPLQIKIKYLDDSIERITKIPQGDWIDLRAAETVELKKGEFKLIPLGIAMELPKGYEAHVVPRSSTFKNFGIIETNSMGVIDESYKGDSDYWFFPAYALRDTVINKNDRICQFRIMKKMPTVELVEVKQLGNKDRGGHGSTGTK